MKKSILSFIIYISCCFSFLFGSLELSEQLLFPISQKTEIKEKLTKFEKAKQKKSDNKAVKQQTPATIKQQNEKKTIPVDVAKKTKNKSKKSDKKAIKQQAPELKRNEKISIPVNIVKKTTQKKDNNETWITIFIHGSITPDPSIGTLFRMFRDKVENSSYMYLNKIKREDPFFYETHPIQEIGLKKIDMTKKVACTPAELLAHIQEKSNKIYKGTKCTNHYYTYGWSGLISCKMRDREANIFWEQLEKELKKYRKKGIEPKIRIVGFSHGPNLVLNLAIIQEEIGIKPTFVIDELICLGMPVQRETDYMIKHPMFKKIYHFYSESDRIQGLDCFGQSSSFSKKKFRDYPKLTVPEKLSQIRIRTAKRPCSKLFYPRKSKYSCDPGHIELWYFGWVSNWYREDFPMYPLPIVAFSEMLVDKINNLSFPTSNITADFRPEQELIVFYDNNDRSLHQIEHFLKKDEFNKLRETALSYKPTNQTHKNYKRHMKKIHHKANKILRSKKRRDVLRNTTLESYYKGITELPSVWII